jgi:hypothetical protein
LPREDADHLDVLAAKFRPESALKRNEWLFMSEMPHVPKVKRGGGDCHAYHEAVSAARAKAAAEIVASVSDWQALRDYAVSLRQRYLLGAALAEAVPTSHETELVLLLDSEVSAELALAFGYAETRFRQQGWPWVEEHLRRSSSARQAARLLRATREYPKAWERADAEGGEVAEMFWREFVYWGLGGDLPYVEEAARRLLGVGRAAAALDFIGIYLERGSDPSRAGTGYAELIADALELLAGRQEQDREAGRLYQHDLVEFFAYLARAGLPEGRLARLEWSYLGALGYDARPVALGRGMASDPNLFAEVVARVYRPRAATTSRQDGGEAEEEPLDEPATEDQRAGEAIALNAYRLLSQWKAVPGLREDGSLNSTDLEIWLTAAREKLKELDRAEVGDIHIGHMLAWTPTDQDGVWPSLAVRDLLEKLQSDDVESGLQTEIVNSRGVTFRSPFSGGAQELELVKRYREQAAKFVDQWPRTAAILRALADAYDRQAGFHDEKAERTHRGLG